MTVLHIILDSQITDVQIEMLKVFIKDGAIVPEGIRDQILNFEVTK